MSDCTFDSFDGNDIVTDDGDFFGSWDEVVTGDGTKVSEDSDGNNVLDDSNCVIDDVSIKDDDDGFNDGRWFVLDIIVVLDLLLVVILLVKKLVFIFIVEVMTVEVALLLAMVAARAVEEGTIPPVVFIIYHGNYAHSTCW